MKNIKVYLLSFLLILIVVFVTGCAEKGKIYTNVDENEWVVYEIRDEKLILTDTEGVTTLEKGATWTLKRDGEGTGVVGNWICETINGEASECNESANISVVKFEGKYVINSNDEYNVEEPMTTEEPEEGFSGEELIEG